MAQAEMILGYAGALMLLVTLAGLIACDRWRNWYAFTLYQIVVVAFTLALLQWYSKDLYMLQVTAVSTVRLAMALEVAGRTFRAFPGARSTLRAILLVLLTATFTLVIAVPTSHEYRGFLGEQQPRLLNGTVWVFTAIAGLILWYRLPVAAFHKAILLPYVPYLVWEAVYLNSRLWETESLTLRCFNQAIYLALASRWAWVAWRVEEPAREPPDEPPRDPFEPKNGLVALLDGR